MDGWMDDNRWLIQMNVWTDRMAVYTGWWMNGAMDRGMDGCMMDEVTSTDG